MARNWCFTDDAGMAFIGIPTSTVDEIYFNAHRYYYKVSSVKISLNLMLNYTNHIFYFDSNLIYALGFTGL